MTREELIEFEEEIKDLFLQKRIRAPVHLSGGNEDALIEIFKEVRPKDWVLSTHRSHYHALLKGIPPELIKEEILKGNSMHLNFREYKFLTSAIVGGIAPIAVGLAMAGERVWCFLGDMAAHVGCSLECFVFARNHNLPVSFVIEDNHFSTDTPTKEVWGDSAGRDGIISSWSNGRIELYSYDRVYPHVGVGEFVQF